MTVEDNLYALSKVWSEAKYNEVALAFFKGALLEDPNGILVAPGENSQSAGRQ